MYIPVEPYIEPNIIIRENDGALSLPTHYPTQGQ